MIWQPKNENYNKFDSFSYEYMKHVLLTKPVILFQRDWMNEIEEQNFLELKVQFCKSKWVKSATTFWPLLENLKGKLRNRTCWKFLIENSIKISVLMKIFYFPLKFYKCVYCRFYTLSTVSGDRVWRSDPNYSSGLSP